MKPKNWDKMDSEKKEQLAIDLLNTKRGSYIISMALYVAIKKLSKRQFKDRPVNDIEDMEMLQEIYPLYKIIMDTEKLQARQGNERDKADS